MKKIIAIGGVPATGKSTLMKRLIEELGITKDLHQHKKIFKYHRHPEKNIFVAGDYSNDELFCGTDRLSMSVQPEAKNFVESLDGVLIFEGDRLFNSSFLEMCADAGELSIFILTASKAVTEFRHHDRGDNQNETFLKSRETKVDNICTNFILSPMLTMVRNETPIDQNEIVNTIKAIAGEV